MKARANLLWSVRREIWEHRYLYIAPLVIAGLVLFGFFVAGLTHMTRRLPLLHAGKQLNVVVMPYSLAASVILVTGWIVGIVYCVEALNAERRDRSILFWKSMPVSDLVTVASKASIPLAVLPLIGCAIALATQIVMLFANTGLLLATTGSAAVLRDNLPLPTMTLVMLYGVAVHVLWFAPVYAWLLLVSAWARRAAFPWAVLPFVAINILELVTLGTSWFAHAMQYRIIGAMPLAFTADAMKGPITQLSQLAPMRFLSSPDLWLGLAFAVAFLAAAVWLRRNREPN